MARFFKMGTKALLLLSCSSLIGSTLNYPLVYAGELLDSDKQTLEIVQDKQEAQKNIQQEHTHSFLLKRKKIDAKDEVEKIEGTSDSSKEEFTTKLKERLISEVILEGTTYPESTVTILLTKDKSLKTTADTKGKFKFSDFPVKTGEQFDIEISNPAKEVLENLTATVEEKESASVEIEEKPVVSDEVEVDKEVTDIELEEELEKEESTESTESTEESSEKPVEESVEKPVKESVEEVQEEVENEKAASEKESVSVNLAESESSSPLETNSASRSTFALPVDQVGTTYYYIKAGDNLKTIASSFKIKLEDLLCWNSISNANLIQVGQIISINGTNNYRNYNKETVSFTSNKQFLDYVSQYAKTIANNYGLYASVMVAQAALETGYGQYSALASKGNNLFGVKAQSDYKGYSIIMRTWEEVNGKTIYIDDYFRLYPSYYESFIDYASKLRNGIGLWDTTFYNGTWSENTTNFRDATLFLTGRYATDSQYYSKLNSIIINNNLTQHDAKGYKDTSYNALVTKAGQSIGNLPFDHLATNNANYKNIKVIENSNTYLGKTVTVNHINRNGTYANIFVNGKEVGWIPVNALTKIDLSIVNVNYDAYFTSKNGTIVREPVAQAKEAVNVTNVAGSTGSYLNKKVQVTSQTKDGMQSYVAINGKALGWVMTEHLGKAVTPYSAILSNGNYEIDSLPWGVPGFEKVSNTSSYMGNILEIIAQSNNGAYLLATLNGKNLGWIDKRAVKPFSYKVVQKQNYVADGKYEIDNLPWGEIGYKKVGKTSEVLGKLVTITKETSNGAYSFIVVDGKEKGWVDTKSFGLKGSSYSALITEGQYHVDTLPWGTPGFKKVGTTANYFGKEIQIAGSTADGKYLLMRENGKDVGWIDVRAVKKFETIAVSYSNYVTGGQYEIDSLPWGEKGYKKTGVTSLLLGQVATVTKESPNRAYAWIKINGKEIGWVDKKALGFNSTPYKAVISEGKYELDTLPWGAPGFKKIGLTSAYLGKQIDIIGSTNTGYLLARFEGKDIGWIDKRSVSSLNTTVVNYSKKITKGNFEINTLPWGVPGFKKIAMTSTIVGKNAQVVLESSNKAYVYVLIDGKPKGWVDKRSF